MNIIPERFFVIGVVVKPHIVMVALNIYFSACGTAIAEPSAVKEPTTPPRNERPEVLNGGLKGREVGAEKAVDVLGPNRSLGVNGAKFGNDSGTKHYTSGNSTSMTLSPESEAVRSDVAKQDNESAYECGDYCGFYGWLPILLGWPLLFGLQKHKSVLDREEE